MPRRTRGNLRRVLTTTLLVLSACAPDRTPDTQALPGTIVVVDASGSEINLVGPATRIISLVPSATETLRALGVDSLLVGRTDFDAQDWLQHLPSVGGGLEPSLEEVIALRPDLVIRFAGEQDTRTPARLDDFGIPHLSVRPDRLEDVYASAILLGRVTAAEAAADALVTSIEAGLDSLAQEVADLPRLNVAYVLGGSPPWVAGPDTYITEVVGIVGGDNVFADLSSLYASVSPEELRARDIDVILVPDRSQFDASLAPQARVEEVGSALEIPGPGVVEAARELAGLLHQTSSR